MKLYQIIMKVPDDFVPEEMQLTASSKYKVEICSEGFIGPESFVEAETVTSVESELADFDEESASSSDLTSSTEDASN